MDFKKYLQEDVLRFWLENAIDNEFGGIFTSLDRNGEVYSDEKSVRFQGRALWVFSKSYNLMEPKTEYLAAAKTIYRFLEKCTDKDGRMFFLVTRDGRSVQKRRYFFSETFAAIGCAELYKATGDREVFERAEQYFDVAWSMYRHPDAAAAKFNPETRNLKALSPIMILLSTAQVMESVGIHSEKYEAIAKEMANEIICGGFLNESVGALMENVSLD